MSLKMAQGDVWYQGEASRRPVIAGNWKLNPATVKEAESLLKLLATNARAFGSSGKDLPEIVVFPPFPYLATALTLLEGSGIKVGCQNIGLETKGAFTGEVAASMVRSLGCDYALLGHSERRSLYDETDDVVNAKVKLALAEKGLGVILCVGETEAEYDQDLLETVVDLQVRKGLSGVPVEEVASRVVIAYEPVWAIGTGKVATPEQAQAAHLAVRRSLAKTFGAEASRAVRVQYGGSVTPASIDSLMKMPDIDGALVGGASLTAEGFARIFEFTPPPALGRASSGGGSGAQPHEFTAQEVVGCANALGESPVWSNRDQALYWVSALDQEVWCWNLQDAPYRRLLDTVPGCVAVAQGPPGTVLVCGESAMLTLDMARPDLQPAFLSRRPEAAGPTRPNDGRVDRSGQLVIGMYNNYHRAGSSVGEDNAGLFRMTLANRGGSEAPGSEERAAGCDYEELLDYRFRVSNCCCFSADGKVMYFADTPTRKVYAFDYDPKGKPANRRLVWSMPPHLPGGPDGAQVDAEGMLWVALNGAGCVVRIDPLAQPAAGGGGEGGRVNTVVNLPVACPTSVTFGGAELDELFITTRGPDGGGLFRFKVPFGVKGLPEPEFIG